MLPEEQLIDLPGFAASGIWATGQEPCPRTLYAWLEAKLVPYHLLPGRRMVSLNAAVSHFRKVSWHWPKGVEKPGKFSCCPPNALQLVRFPGLMEMGIWHPSALPCVRTWRGMVGRGQIPYYQIAKTQFFRKEEVVHCLLSHTRIEAA